MKVKIPDYTYEELTKLRCWLSGYKEGRNMKLSIPGEDILRQLLIAIKES